MTTSLRQLGLLVFAAATIVPVATAQTQLPRLRPKYQNHSVSLALTLDRPSYVLLIERSPDGTFEAAEPETTLAPLPAGEHTIVLDIYRPTPNQPLPAAQFGLCWDIKYDDTPGLGRPVWNGNCGLDAYPSLPDGWAPVSGSAPPPDVHSLLVVDVGQRVSVEAVDATLKRLGPGATPSDVLAGLAKGLKLDAGAFRWTLAVL